MFQHFWEPPLLYSWSVLPPGDDGAGAVGVSDDEQHALAHAAEALRAAPAGAYAVVHRVTLSLVRTAYHYECPIARGSIDAVSGGVMWQCLRTSRVILPPEAISAGLHDMAQAELRGAHGLSARTVERRSDHR